MNIINICLLVTVSISLTSCVGGMAHSTITYTKIQTNINYNNSGLLRLNLGMDQKQVAKLLGDPERSEGYEWGIIWFYRTGMSKGMEGIYSTVDEDYTPVAFDKNKKLLGWGRSFYEQSINRHELKITNK